MVVTTNSSSSKNLSGSSKVETVEITAKIRKTVQSTREIVGKSYSEADTIDPNESVQKLLNQEPFHLVKKKRDWKKENMTMGNRVSVDPVRHPENNGQMVKYNTSPDPNARRENFPRWAIHGPNREFRVVRDNRVNEYIAREVKPDSLQLTTNEQLGVNHAEKRYVYLDTF